METYKIVEFSLEGLDGIKLFCKGWESPDFDPEKVIVFHHGLGEHCDRYQNLINFFRDQNYSFFSYDARGHGRSTGRRGDSQSIMDFVFDLENYIYFIKRKYNISKPFLLGHSFGGLIATLFTIQHSNQEELQGLILSSPAFRIHTNIIQALKVAAGEVLYFIKPDLVLRTSLKPEDLSHNRKVVEEYRKDAFVHSFLSVRLGVEMIHTFSKIKHRLKKIKIPVWIAHSTEDKITNYLGSKELFNLISSEKKTIKLYKGFRHELFNEVSTVPLEDLKHWIQELEKNKSLI
ncbi:MAG: lysophospholipase [Leptospiraceae bacterium]|nr:lysophospholipase [Leptospiraceae bacterium]MDW7977054.1 alpha/beta hydrolase [Leptospiraceae bacterium]